MSPEMYADGSLVKANVSSHDLSRSGLTVAEFKEQGIRYPINTKNSGTRGQWILIRREGIIVDGGALKTFQGGLFDDSQNVFEM